MGNKEWWLAFAQWRSKARANPNAVPGSPVMVGALRALRRAAQRRIENAAEPWEESTWIVRVKLCDTMWQAYQMPERD